MHGGKKLRARGVSSPSHTRVRSDCLSLELSSHPTVGWGSCGWFYSWTPPYQPAWTWHRDHCCLQTKRLSVWTWTENATVSYKRGITSPPLSRTARLCPLFSSISSLYIPEPWTDRSGGTAEEHEAPTACQQKSRDYCQTASKRKSVTSSPRKPVFQSKLSHISPGNKKSFSKQRLKLILHPLSSICSRKMTRADWSI